MSGRISAFWSEKGPLLAAMLADPAWYKGRLFRTRDAARELGCSLAQVQNKIANLRHGQPISDQVVEIPKAPAPPEPPAPPPVDPLVVERERQERIRTLKQERELLTAVAGEQSLRAFLESLTAKYAVPFPPPKPAKPTPIKGGTTVESLVSYHLTARLDPSSYHLTVGYWRVQVQVIGIPLEVLTEKAFPEQTPST